MPELPEAPEPSETQETPEIQEMPETLQAPTPSHNQPANGFKNVSIEGSNNVSPVMYDTLGIIFLGIISLLLLFDVRRLTRMLLKAEGKGCDCQCCQGKGCNCDCGKDGK